MKIVEAYGTKVYIPGPCECGAVCTDETASKHVVEWDHLRKKCSICGGPIKLTEITMKHFHKDHIDKEDTWSAADNIKFEPNWSWLESGPFGRVQVDVHYACAREVMPHGNFDEIVYGRPEEIPAEHLPSKIYQKTCKTCGVTATDEDVRRVAARLWSFVGPCVYCGEPIKLLAFWMFHGSLSGKHTGRWHFKDYRREPMIHWGAYKLEAPKYTSLEFVGHFHCFVKAMKHVRWLEVNRDYIANLPDEVAALLKER